FRLFGFVVLIAILGRAWVNVLVSPDAMPAAILINCVIELAILIFVVIQVRSDICNWLLGLIDEKSRKDGGIRAVLAQHWHWIALPVLIILAFARAHDALSYDVKFPYGAILTIYIFVGLLLAETLWSFILKRHRTTAAA